MNSDSKRFAFNWNDFINLGKNAGLVGLAAALAYMGDNLGELDMGTSSALFVPIFAIMIDAAVKWAKNNQKPSE
jgi:hypothetical protein